MTSLITSRLRRNHIALIAPVLQPLKVPGCIVYTDAERYKWWKAGHSPDSETNAPHTNNNPTSTDTHTHIHTHKTRHEEAELLSFPLCRRTTISSQRIPLSLLARLVGKRLEMWLFLEPSLCVCVCLCLLVINGGGKLRRLFLPSLAHDTQPARPFWLSYATNSGQPVFWPRAHCGYATASVISTQAKKKKRLLYS